MNSVTENKETNNNETTSTSTGKKSIGFFEIEVGFEKENMKKLELDEIEEAGLKKFLEKLVKSSLENRINAKEEECMCGGCVMLRESIKNTDDGSKKGFEFFKLNSEKARELSGALTYESYNEEKAKQGITLPEWKDLNEKEKNCWIKAGTDSMNTIQSSINSIFAENNDLAKAIERLTGFLDVSTKGRFGFYLQLIDSKGNSVNSSNFPKEYIKPLIANTLEDFGLTFELKPRNKTKEEPKTSTKTENKEASEEVKIISPKNLPETVQVTTEIEKKNLGAFSELIKGFAEQISINEEDQAISEMIKSDPVIKEVEEQEEPVQGLA